MQELQFSPFGCHVNGEDEVQSSPSSNDDNESPMVGTSIDAKRALWLDQEATFEDTNIDAQWTDETLLLHSNLTTQPNESQHPTETTPLL